MASWFTTLIDKLTPWDRGGEVQRRIERKRQEDQQAAQTRQYTPQVSQPQNVFSQPQQNSYSKVFDNPINAVKLPTAAPQVQEYDAQAVDSARKAAEQLQKPQQSFFNKVRDQFDANTEADKYRRAVRDFKETNANMVSRGVPQDQAQKEALRFAKSQMNTNYKSWGDINREATLSTANSAKNFLVDTAKDVGKWTKTAFAVPVESARAEYASLTGNKAAEQAANRRIDERLFGRETLKDNKIGNVELATSLLGATSILPVAKGAGLSADAAKLGLQEGGIRGLLTGSKGLLSGLDEALLGIRNIFKRPDKIAQETKDITDVLTPQEIDDILKETKIKVSQPTPITDLSTGPTDINVRNLNRDKQLIREVGGDAPNVTRVPSVQEAAEQRATRKFTSQPAVRPDQAIEGVTAAEPEKLFTLEDNVVARGQDKVVQDYADWLKSMGEGNGVNLVNRNGPNVPYTGENGITRISNNVRFGDTGGKRMTKADWLAEARRQIEAGEADPAIMKAFKDAADPEVQSLLARGEQPPAPDGKPITVKEVKAINVQDKTNVPANLPETPGKVRFTAQDAPMATKTEAAAAQAPARVPENAGSTTSAVDGTDAVAQASTPPKTATPPSLPNTGNNSELEKMVQNLRDNQKAYRSEKKLRKAEFGRRQAEKARLYDQYRAEGMSAQEAKAAADKALGGTYAKSSVSTPQVSEETVNKILDATKGDQNTQNAFSHWFDPNRTEALRDWERTRIRGFIQKQLGEDAAQAVDEAIIAAEKAGDRSIPGKIADFTTSSIAAGDISAVGRQGLSGWINHPGMSKGAWDDALQALIHSDGEKKFASQLLDNPNVAFIQENMGGKFLTLSDVADEARGMDTGSKLTGWYVNPSNRHYNTYLDSLRLRQKEAIIERYGGQEGFLAAAEKANPEDPKKWMKAWNDVIDRQSGRGSFSNFGSPTVGDMQVLFSARNLASKFQRLTAPLQVGLLKTNPSAYLYQLKETATQAAVLGATLAALHKSGIAEIENGKIKIGRTRIDITGGFATILKAGNDLRKEMGIMHDTSKDSTFGRSGDTVIKDFFQNQLSPTIGSLLRLSGVDWAKGKDKYGNNIDAKWWAQTTPLPAVVNSVINSVSEGQNPLETARNVALDSIGLNTTTYKSAEDKAQIAEADIRSQNQALEKYIPKGTSELTTKVLNGAADDAYYASDWEAYQQAAQAKIDAVNKDENSTHKQKMEAELEKRRADVYKSNNYSPDFIDTYKSTTLSDWRKMGDPESDSYDPKMYQKLWDIDQNMSRNKASFKKGDPEKGKYYAKESKKGGRGSRGGSRSSGFSADFGTFKSGFAPKTKQYESIAVQSGSVPRIKRERPNIVHKISTSG